MRRESESGVERGGEYLRGCSWLSSALLQLQVVVRHDLLH